MLLCFYLPVDTEMRPELSYHLYFELKWIRVLNIQIFVQLFPSRTHSASGIFVIFVITVIFVVTGTTSLHGEHQLLLN